ncbi:oxygenase MpaB family protein [Nocardia sp. GTS18]|uniref:oxygenase MpaB family protein n=1 Tax=Nocardia sp. GTS18 TaxID=1778064 RepID=UPI0015EEE0F4|nr:oxygenase MpaB family protein [Nocardia sp. GTS18]
MTCPVSHQPASTDDGVPHDVSSAVERFERVGGSVLFGLFAVGLFDQPMLPPVSAALEATGRSRYQPWARAVRTAAADQLIYHGTEADAAAEAERLMLLHRAVKGVAPDGQRYSAFEPQAWNWILYSTFFVQRGAYIALTNTEPTAAQNQALWDHYRRKTTGLHLRGRNAPIEDYRELVAHYERMAAEELRVTPALEAATASVRHAPRPDFLPALTGPLWRVGSPVLSHVVMLLGCGIMHPKVRARMPITWTARHDTEFRLLTALLRTAFDRLPATVTDSPMARNRRRYERLAGKYRRVGLTSFAPDPALRPVGYADTEPVSSSPS